MKQFIAAVLLGLGCLACEDPTPHTDGNETGSGSYVEDLIRMEDKATKHYTEARYDASLGLLYSLKDALDPEVTVWRTQNEKNILVLEAWLRRVEKKIALTEALLCLEQLEETLQDSPGN